VAHDGSGVLAGVPDPFTATRYHSLTIEPPTLPDSLVANGHTASGIIMAIRHTTLPLHGVQFHPESVLTEGGHRMLANWLVTCGDPGAVERSAGMSPLVHDAAGVARMVAAS
jgi:para-aminobenzoate synthetase component 2